MNTLTHVGNLFAFIGGLGMFLYGMDIMASGLQKTAGNKMKDLLGYLTNNRILGVLVGALVTAIIQSSSATTVMVVGFVNAGIMNLTQAAGVIMGANVGTTITAWLVSANEWAGALKPDFFAPFIFRNRSISSLHFLTKQKMTQKAEIAVGFGILFIGLSSMSSSIQYIRIVRYSTKHFRYWEEIRSLVFSRRCCYSDHSEFICICRYFTDISDERNRKLEISDLYYVRAEYWYLYHSNLI